MGNVTIRFGHPNFRIEERLSIEEAKKMNMVTLLYGIQSRQISKEELSKFILEVAEKHNQGKKRVEFTDIEACYLDAVEWLNVNLFRIVGIQLYSDGMIRLNIWPDFIENGKKCVFLDDAFLVDESVTEPMFEALKGLVLEERGS